VGGARLARFGYPRAGAFDEVTRRLRVYEPSARNGGAARL
jgi:hypothetical protein